jgi:hypothetical protein
VLHRPLREWLRFQEGVIARHRPGEWGGGCVDIAQADRAGGRWLAVSIVARLEGRSCADMVFVKQLDAGSFRYAGQLSPVQGEGFQT